MFGPPQTPRLVAGRSMGRDVATGIGEAARQTVDSLATRISQHSGENAFAEPSVGQTPRCEEHRRGGWITAGCRYRPIRGVVGATNTGYEHDNAHRRAAAATIRGTAISPRRQPAMRQPRAAGHVVRPSCPRAQPSEPRRRIEFRRHSRDPSRIQRAMDLEANRPQSVP
jgi:hypothetical protein